MRGFKNKYALVLGITLFFVAAIDLLNADRFLYRSLCDFFYNMGFKSLACATFYDIPIWQAGIIVVIVVAAYFIFHAIEYHHKQSKASK